MSFDFSQLPTTNYRGVLKPPAPVSLCGVSHSPVTVPIVIPWENYFFGTGAFAPATGNNGRGGIAFDLSSIASAVKPIDAIRSLYVDNSNNPTAVFIVFPDTGFALSVAAQETKYAPVFTNTLRFVVYSTAMVNALPIGGPGIFPSTQIFANNFLSSAFEGGEAPPSLGMYICSQPGSNPLGVGNTETSIQSPFFAPGAIADQVFNNNSTVGVGFVFTIFNIFNQIGYTAVTGKNIRIQSLRTVVSGVLANSAGYFQFVDNVGHVYLGADVSNGAAIDYSARVYHDYSGLDWIVNNNAGPFNVQTNCTAGGWFFNFQIAFSDSNY